MYLVKTLEEVNKKLTISQRLNQIYINLKSIL